MDDTPNIQIELRHPREPQSEPAFAPNLYEAVGRAVLAWGSMECHLDMLTRMAINIEGRERELKVNLEWKLDQLKKVFRDTPQLNPWLEAVRELSALLKDWGKDRHTLIHSIVTGFSALPQPSISIRHVKHPGGQDMAFFSAQFTAKSLLGFADQCREVHRGILHLIEAIQHIQAHETGGKGQSLDPLQL